MHDFPGKVTQGVNVIYEGDVRIHESPNSRRLSEWTAGFLLPRLSALLHGIFRLELDDGRWGTMFCTAAEPRTPHGTDMKFQGTGPLLVIASPAPNRS